MKPGSLLFVSILTLFAQKTFAWGDLGHSTIGYIADYKLTAKGKGFVYQILGPEPLATSAVWPDGVRSDSRYVPFASYHFFEIPSGYTYATLPPEMRASMDADTILSQAPALLLKKDVTREQKIILLRYLIHLVGDVHQPLHIGNGVDRGANLCDVKWRDPETKAIISTNLHSAIDDKLPQNLVAEIIENDIKTTGKRKGFYGYREVGDYLLKNMTDIDFAKVSQDGRDVWYNESQALHAVTYPDAKPVEKPEDRPYCKIIDKATGKIVNGKYNPAKVDRLKGPYIKKMLPVVKKQLILAGYRLAGLINKMAEESDAPEWSSDMDRAIFEPLMLKNIPREPSGKNK